ncbi:hypothetical protein BKA70DRAFT_382559 [Coprinopsis sp. MPI-PUGE-AT-0042]|nr:hypothetical protein BKA70DRAFT_382559 [Coprinopsis sp. MPI-PUGE-AT-0042]
MPTTLFPESDARLLPYTKCNEELPEGLASFCRQTLEGINQKMELLRQQMEVLQRDQVAYRELLSPARRLPNEIIIQIIQSCFKDPTILDAADRETFAVLRSVCQRWRTISFASHDLWRGLAIANESEDIGRKLRSWFDRAGLLPLKLHASYDSSLLPVQVQTLILDPGRRWAHISLHLSPMTLHFFLQDVECATNAWSQVQHLELRHHHQGMNDSIFPTSFFVRLANPQRSNLSALKSLHMERIALNTPGVAATPCHATLSTLCLTTCTVSFDMMKLLLDPHSLPRLQELTLIHTSPVDRSEPMPMALHPGMRRVNVTGVTTNAFLSMLTFPNLEVACISYDDSPSTHMPVAVSHFLEQSGRNLHALSLVGNPFRADVRAVAAAIAPCLPALRSLHVPNLEIFRELLDTEERVFPQLEMVSCNRSQAPSTKAEVDAILAYVRQRGLLKGDQAPLTIRLPADIQDDSDLHRLRAIAWVHVHVVS